MLHTIWHAFLHTLQETALSLPFLFGAFLLIEYLEHRQKNRLGDMLARARGWSVPVGAVAGCIPQCGVSIAASNLFSGGVISAGTLLAVYLATSDEALLILASNPGAWPTMLALVGTKLLIAILAGYLFDFITRKRITATGVEQNDLCHDCGCHDHGGGIVKPTIKHALRIYLFIFIISFVLNLVVEWIGEEQLSRILLSGSILQPMLTALLGLIPNCAVSVALAELFLAGGISFSSMVAGLCTAAGMGLVVLFRTNKNMRVNFLLLGALYVIGAGSGMILQLFGV